MAFLYWNVTGNLILGKMVFILKQLKHEPALECHPCPIKSYSPQQYPELLSLIRLLICPSTSHWCQALLSTSQVTCIYSTNLTKSTICHQSVNHHNRQENLISTLWVLPHLVRSCQPFWMMSFGQIQWHRITTIHKKMSNFIIIPVSADGLAPLGARPSAATGMIRIAPMYILVG